MTLIPAGAFLDTRGPKRRSKYRAVKVTIDNIVFDSKREAMHYIALKALFRAGKIRNLEIQPAFRFDINGETIFTYYADFAYFEDDARIVVDVKGFKTPLYRLKKKLIEAVYHIEIKEVR